MRMPERRGVPSHRRPWDDGGAAVPEVLVPEQVVARIALTPERRLLYAVLDQALHDLRIARMAEGSARHRVEAWFDSQDTSWPCSFENICAGLGFDADAIRTRVLPSRVGPWIRPAANG